MAQAVQHEASPLRRVGGHKARLAFRGAGPRKLAVHPGIMGGTYRPLGERDMERIHATVLDVLETIGMAGALPILVEAAKARGCPLDDRGRIHFPRALVEDVIAGAARNFTIRALNPKYDVDLSGTRVHFTVGGEAISVLDFQTGRFRPSTLLDIYNMARLADGLEHIHRFGAILVPTELPDLFEFAINRTYAMLAGTAKTSGLSVLKPEYLDAIVALCDTILGREGAYLRNPFCTVGGCPIVSPLSYGDDNSGLIIAAARRGIPTTAVIASQAGATAPAALAGALVQNTAETIAALLMVNFVRPGHPMIFGNWPFVSDLRTGAFTGGGGEEAVLTAAAAQMAKFYDLPCSVGAGMTDSKVPDAQAGYEKGLTTALAGLAGANLVSESAGMVGSLLGTSFEAMVIDNDMLGSVQRAIRGIEVTEETLSYDVIKQAVDGPGHFLGSQQTLDLMESEYLYPTIADRSTPSEWEEKGALDIRQRAHERAREILSSHYPQNISFEADRRIRERFPIRLPSAVMTPRGGRW
ncbi:MAG: trimethylamine methyltransferase family protein [Alphaproteobacteria bacterium]